MLSDGAAWIRNAGDEIFAGMNPAFVLVQCHFLEYAAAAVRSLTLDKDRREAWRMRIMDQLNKRLVARIIDDLKPQPALSNLRQTNNEYVATSTKSADCRSDPLTWKVPASKSSGTACRKRASMHCSPSNAVEINHWDNFLDWRSYRIVAPVWTKNMLRPSETLHLTCIQPSAKYSNSVLSVGKMRTLETLRGQ